MRLAGLVFRKPFETQVGGLQLMSQCQHAAVQVQHGIGSADSTSTAKSLYHLGCGRCGSAFASAGENRRSRHGRTHRSDRPARSVGRNPAAAHGAVTAFGAGGTGGAPCGRILQLIRNVGHFEQAEFLALIHVGGAGQRHLHHDRGAGAGAERARSSRYVVPSARQPVERQSMVFAGRHLGQRVAGDLGGPRRGFSSPKGGGPRRAGRFGTFLDGEVHVVADPILLGELEVEDLAEIVGEAHTDAGGLVGPTPQPRRTPADRTR